MGYIYKITNKINNKIYIGQTRINIHQRFRDHWRAAQNERLDSRDERNYPIHLAMVKYGIDNFIVECIEECENDLLDEKEKYYIELFDSYKTGYNAALGGKGHQKYNYDQIVNFFLQNNNSLVLTCKHFNVYDQVVYSALKSKGIDYKNLVSAKKKEVHNKKILMVEENKTFNSMSDINKYFGKTVHPNIRRCLNGITKKAYGYHWKEIENE